MTFRSYLAGRNRASADLVARAERLTMIDKEAKRLNTYLNAISALAAADDEAWVKFSTRLLIAEACMAVADAEHNHGNHPKEN